METLTISSVEASDGIDEVKNVNSHEALHIYDAAGRRLPNSTVDQLSKGLYIIEQGGQAKKILID